MKKCHEGLCKKFQWYKKAHELPMGNIFFWAILLFVSIYATSLTTISGQYLVASVGEWDEHEEPAVKMFYQGDRKDLKEETEKSIEKQEKDKTVKRYKISEGKKDYIDKDSPRHSQTIKVDLFDGQSVTLDKVKYIDRENGNYTWIGRTEDIPGGQAIFTVADNHLTGYLSFVDPVSKKAATYSVESLGENMYSVRENDFSEIEEEPSMDQMIKGTDRASKSKTTSSSAATTNTNATLASGDPVTVVDVLVLYSSQSAALAGPSMTSQAQVSIDAANLAYANSGLPLRLNLVHVEPIPYDEGVGDFYAMLDDLTYHRNGASAVGTIRDAYQADLVTMFVESSSYCGLSFINVDVTYAYSIVKRTCATSNLSLAHELGHNFGLLHDPANYPGTYPFAYGHGYVDPLCQFRTVMAYPACATTRVPYFSNPNIIYPGTNSPMGTFDVSDNSRVLSERASAVASFLTATTTYCLRSSPTITVTPTSQTGSSGQSLSYNMNVVNNDGSNCPSTIFQVTPTLPNLFTQTPSQFSLTLAPGGQISQPFVITSGTSVTPASYTFSETVVNNSEATYFASTSAVYSVKNVDVTPPTVNIVRPTQGAVLSKKASSKVTIDASASDASGISQIKISVDGSLKKSCTSATTCSYSWTYSNVSNGQHTISVVATDNSVSKNQATASVTVSVAK